MSDPQAEKRTEPETGTSLENAAGQPKEEDESAYPHGLKLALIMGSSYLSMFLVALDRLIVTTAIPKITDQFHSVDSVGWYGSAYLMTNCAFQPLLGKLYVLYSVKTVFLVSILVFEVGSAVCGAAPNSIALIVGRAIAGCGSAGIFSGAITITVYSTPLRKRPIYQGLFGAVFGLANVIAPLIGGALADSKATWRWCFYINLPIGGLSIFLIALLLHIPARASTQMGQRAKLVQLDAPGVVALLAGIVCLVLALQWGGSAYPWRNGRVVALLVVAGVMLIAFAGIQALWPRTATVPPRIAVRRSIAAAALAMFATGATMMMTMYYLPIWFQAIQGVGAAASGVRLLPLVLGQVLGSLAGGIVIQRIGYYTPVMIFSAAVMVVGSGLLTRLQVHSTTGQWIGYQIPFGIGLGTTMQAPLLAAQTVLPAVDVPIGTALMFFAQLLGGAVFVSVGQSLFDNDFERYVQGVPGVDPHQVLRQGATTLADLPEPTKGLVLVAYNRALRTVFITGLAMACVAFVASLGLEWRSVKKPASKDGAGGPEATPAANATHTSTDEDTVVA